MRSLFSSLETRLRQEAPEQIAAAEALSENVVDPATSNADQCWDVIWNKPLYANTRVAIGDRKVKALVSSMRGAWRTIGQPGGDYEVTKIGRGMGAAEFSIRGDRAREIRDRHRVACHRMLAIQGGAVALRRRAMADGHAPYADIAGLSVRDAIMTIRTEMGPYWGPVSVLHFLTDLGLACKPDRHLVRTMSALGMAVDGHWNGVPSLGQSVAINEGVRRLAHELYGTAGAKPIRYLDKVLMEISRQGILDTE
jgi:hypothetical protein